MWCAMIEMMFCVVVYWTYIKSICYKVLPFTLNKKLDRVNSLVVAISMLISLMVNQVCNFKSRCVKASVMFSVSKVDKVFIVANEDLVTDSHLFCVHQGACV